MGQFIRERKPDSTGIATRSDGYFLLYNGKRVQRQQNDGQWIDFETQDANFNPDYFEVLDINKNQSVGAKFLKYNGDYILNSDGNPYIVPYTFDFEAFIAKYKSLAGLPAAAIKFEMVANFRQGGIDDLQRSYDGGYGYFDHPPVPSFTAGASFVYGVAIGIVGLSVDDSLYYAGSYNNVFGKNPTGEQGNNPENPLNIRRGHSLVDSLRNYGELSTSPNTPFNKADTNNNTYDFTTKSSTPILEPNRYFLEFEMKSGDGWDTLEAIYGSQIRDLPEYGMIQSADGSRFRIEVTGDRLAELYYSGKLRSDDKGFAIIGNGRVLSHVTAHFGEEIDPDSVAKLNKIEKDSIKPGQEVTVFLVPSNNTNSSSITSISDAVSNKNSLNASISTAYEQRWQENFQTTLGPTNAAFVHAEPINGYTLEYNPNGILWNVNAVGIPTIEDFDKYIEQQRVIESATDQTIIEMGDIGVPVA